MAERDLGVFKRILDAALGGQPLGDSSGLFPQYQMLPQNSTSPAANMIQGALSEGIAIPGHILSAYQRDIGIPLSQFILGPSGGATETVPAGALSPAAFDARFGSPAAPFSIPGMDIPVAPSTIGLGAPTLPGGPDYSEMDEWLKKAEPTAEDPAIRDRLAEQLVWEGLAGGAANIDTSIPGAVGAALAQIGAGASAGRRQGTQYDQEADRAEGAESRDYALAMAEVTGNRAKEAAARQREAFERMQPKVLHASDKGVIIQRPDASTGQMVVERVDVAGTMQRGHELMGTLEGLGADAEVAKAAVYDFYKAEDNLPALKMEIIQSEIAAGRGNTLFGEAYAAHLADVMDEFPSTGDPEIDRQMQEREVANRLFVDTDGNDDWIAEAAKFGNIFATRLLQDMQ